MARKPKPILKVFLSVRVPVRHVQAADRLAEKRKTTRSVIVAEALEAYLPIKP